MQSYLNLTPTPAWSLSKGLATNPNNRMDDSFSRVAGDFDGDGRAELAFFSGDAGAQFDPGSIISNWSDIQYPSDDLMGALFNFFLKYQTSIFLQTPGWSLTNYNVNVTDPS